MHHVERPGPALRISGTVRERLTQGIPSPIPPGAGGRGLESTDSVRPVEVTIRTYERRDAGAVADVFYRSAREVALSDYTAEQVKAWVPGRWDAEQEHRRSGDGRLVLVAADESGHVVAFIDLEPDGHIDRLFCAPEAAGRSIASRLYEALETAARAGHRAAVH